MPVNMGLQQRGDTRFSPQPPTALIDTRAGVIPDALAYRGR
jgi:hypothetical protein